MLIFKEDLQSLQQHNLKHRTLQVLLVKQLIKSNHLSHISPPFCHNIKNIKDSDEKLKRNIWKKKDNFHLSSTIHKYRSTRREGRQDAQKQMQKKQEGKKQHRLNLGRP